MRILIHSNAPWVPTGYGIQGKILADELSKAGHTVGFSCLSGLGGADITWREPATDTRAAGRSYQCLPSGQLAFGIDVLIPHAQRFQADLIITCMDFYKLAHLGTALTQVAPVLSWTPVDCYPLGAQDRYALEQTKALPVAMSRFGEAQLASFLGGTDKVRYAPHAVDTEIYHPLDDRDGFREELQIGDRFVVGLVAANKDTLRKGFPEQFQAFAHFHKKHSDSVLLVHSIMRCTAGLDLGSLAEEMGIADAIMFSDQYIQDSGLFDAEMMNHWYNACDVLSLCSYGEGFGVPLIEAQAAGTPVVTTNGSASAELVGPGFLVDGDPFWNPVHNAWWTRPRIEEIVKGYTHFYTLSDTDLKNRRERSVEFAGHYEQSKVFEKYWAPILKEIENVAS